MKIQYRANQFRLIATLLLAGGLIVGGAFTPYSALQADASVAFKPSKSGAPGKIRGGASRGDVICAQTPTNSTQRFTLLTPADSNYGLTVAGHPTFFAYVPPTSASKMFFSLKDESGKVHYQTTQAITGQGGVVKMMLPASMPALEVGKYYQWGAAILCSGKLRPDSPFVSGWVQRIEPGSLLANQLKTAALLDRATVYGEQGIWYDTLSTLAELRSQTENAETVAEWRNLLSSVGLGAIAAEPFASQP